MSDWKDRLTQHDSRTDWLKDRRTGIGAIDDGHVMPAGAAKPGRRGADPTAAAGDDCDVFARVGHWLPRFVENSVALTEY